MRFSLRTLILATTLLTITATASYRAWTKPYARFGTWPNGQRAWEEWERRTILAELEFTRSVRWYPNGQIAYEYDKSEHVGSAWDPDGNVISGGEWTRFLKMEIPDESKDSYRPFEDFLDYVDWMKYGSYPRGTLSDP